MNGCLPTEPNTVLSIYAGVGHDVVSVQWDGCPDLPRLDFNADSVPSVVLAAAAPASGDGPPSSLGAGAGGATGQPFGEVRSVPAPPTSRVPEPMIHVENPAFTALVESEGTRLCLDGPADHANAAPCFLHLHAARRDLMGRYIGQQDGGAY
jgi:hypothetical protein